MKCATCGYERWWHEGTTKTKCPAQAQGKWREPDPPGRSSWREIMREDAAARRAAFDEARAAYVPPIVLPPQVPARWPAGPGEIAGYQGRQAVGLGRAAAQRGWAVTARYWRAGDGKEGCGVWLSRGELRALATWERKPGQQGSKSGWSGGVAYAWRTDVTAFPTPIGHTALVDLITST